MLLWYFNSYFEHCLFRYWCALMPISIGRSTPAAPWWNVKVYSVCLPRLKFRVVSFDKSHPHIALLPAGLECGEMPSLWFTTLLQPFTTHRPEGIFHQILFLIQKKKKKTEFELIFAHKILATCWAYDVTSADTAETHYFNGGRQESRNGVKITRLPTLRWQNSLDRYSNSNLEICENKIIGISS